MEEQINANIEEAKTTITVEVEDQEEELKEETMQQEQIKEDKSEKKKKKEKKKKEPRVPYRKLYLFADAFDWFLMFIGAISAMGHGAVLPAFSLIIGKLIDALNEGNPNKLKQDMTDVSLIFLYIGGGAWIVAFLQYACWMAAAERQGKRIREAYLKAILKQNIGWFDEINSGQLSTRIASDTILIQSAIGEKVGSLFQYSFTFVFGFSLAFYKGWQFTLVLLSVVPFIAIAGGFMMKLMASLSNSGQKAYATAGAIASETFSGIRTVAAFTGELIQSNKYISNLSAARKVGIKKSFVSGFGLGLMQGLFFWTYALAFWYGSKLVVDGVYTGGDILSNLFAVVIGAFALGQCSPSIEAISKGTGAAYKMYTTMERVSPIDPTSESGFKPDKESSIEGNIIFQDVIFRYPTRPEVQVLNKLNLEIKAGQTIALVGESGCGKSSTISLIQRFYDPESGSIKLDGYSLSEFNINWLRKQFGYVGQEPVLFSGTIAENITYGKDDATQEEIEAAAKAANAHIFISKFPDGYNTFVGEKGTQLSGGQKQRIAIARAIIKNPKILLLDEATSALDNKSEKIVQEALDEVMKNRTTIVIAHRLSTIRNADKIFVIDKGVIVESGNHEELMNLGGIYKSLVSAQDGQNQTSEVSQENLTPEKFSSESLERNIKDDNQISLQVISEKGTEEKQSKASCCSCCKGKSKPKKEEDVVSVRRIFALNKREFPFMFFGTIGSMANGLVNPMFSIIFANILNIYYLPKDQINSKIVQWILTFIAIGVGTLIANTVQTFFFGISGEYLTQRLREMSFKAIIRNEVGWFDLRENSSGVLTSRLSSDTALVEGLAGVRMGLIIQNISTIIAGLTIAFISGWQLTLVVLATAPLLGFANAMQMQAFKGFSGKTQNLLAEANGIAIEAFANIRTIAAFTREHSVFVQYSNKLEEPKRISIKTALFGGVLVGLSEFCTYVSYFISFYYGGILIYNGTNSFFQVMKVIMAIALSAMSIGQASAFLPDSTKARVAASAIFKLLDRKSEIDSLDEKNGKQLSDIEGKIEFKNVHFTYPSRLNAPVLKGIDFEVNPGQVIALVGQSGCGKSSIVGLLERYYNIQEGEIYVDGNNIKDLNTRWLRKQFGYVGQEPVLFSGTIAENIAFSKEGNATQEEIEAAAKAANAHIFISKFPDGYNTFVGEKGTQLSGGQKQRIAIARAIIKNPKILLLDEATSALDTESEKIVQEALDQVMKNRTTIVIAHRLSTIRSVDKIFVIDKGVIVESGTYEELIAKKKTFYRLAKTQKK